MTFHTHTHTIRKCAQNDHEIQKLDIANLSVLGISVSMATFSGPWLFRPHLQGWDAARPFLSPTQLDNQFGTLLRSISVLLGVLGF